MPYVMLMIVSLMNLNQLYDKIEGILYLLDSDIVNKASQQITGTCLTQIIFPNIVAGATLSLATERVIEQVYDEYGPKTG